MECTNTIIPCTNRILVRINESQKVEILSTKEYQQDTSIVLSHVAEVKEKESNGQTTYQSVTLKHKGELNQAQSSVQIIFIKMKEKEAKTLATSLSSLQILGLIAIVVINKDSNGEKEDKEENPKFNSLNPNED